LATAESLTGGQLAAAITAVPGASAVYVGGVVSYATALKISMLDVPAALIESEGVISAACAEAMARGVRTRSGSTYGLATTGVAGPTEQEGQPVGTVYVGLAGPTGSEAFRLSLNGTRAEIQHAACEAAIELLAAHLGDAAE
jgi:PncC family amidohydrolase